MRREQGSVIIFVLVSMLFFITVLMLAYSNQMDKISNQKKEIDRIQSQYNADKEIDIIYEGKVDKLSKIL